MTGRVHLKAPWEIAMMRESGRLLAEVVEVLRGAITEGMSTAELDAIGEDAIRSRDSIPSFKGYRGGGNRPYPASLCISIDEQVVHGIPGKRRFKQGEVVSVDLGLIYRGYHADTAFTVVVGGEEAAPPRVRQLLDATRESLYRGIAQARPGNRLGDIGHAVQSHVEAQGFSVIREYVGHGIGRELHEPPSVPNYGEPGTGMLIRPGLCIAIEPMVAMGDYRTRVLRDGWTVVTRDGSIAAHFEHTIAITENGAEILTKLPED